MVTLKRKYSWWSPKNSKWLPENLTDMDAKVTVMTKLIKEDAVRTPRRLKTHNKKRPDQLLKLVEESYRAYLALAERYDYAIGALHQARKTMSDAYPNEIPVNDDTPTSGSPGVEGFKVPQKIHVFLYPSGLHSEGSCLSQLQSRSAGSKRLRQGNYLFGSGGVPEQAKFSKRRVAEDQNICNKDNDPKAHKEHKVNERDRSSKNGLSGQSIKTRVISEDELVGKIDDVVVKLKQMIAKLQDGKKYHQILEKLSNMELRKLSQQANKEENELEPSESISALEMKLSHSHEEARVLNERASKAEAEVQILKQDLTRLEGENEAVILRYKQCLEKITDYEAKLSHAEDETRRYIERTKTLDEEILSCTMSIKILQDEVLCLTEKEQAGVLNEKVLNERASKAETEVQFLKKDLIRLEGESEAAILRYKQCLEKISGLEAKLSHAEEETRRHVERTKILDEKNLSCTMSIEILQDEVLRLKEAEEAGVLHEQVFNERASKAETEVQILKQNLARLEGESEAAILRYKQCLEKISDLETKLFDAEDETRRHTEATKILNEKNLSCTMSIKSLQDEVLHLKEAEEVLNERASKAETAVQNLKQDLTRLEGENEAAILLNKQCSEKISDLEAKLSLAKDESRRHIERTKILDEKDLSSAMSIEELQDEVLHLKEAEETGLLNERLLDERASQAETEVQLLKQDLVRLEGEYEAAILQHKQCSEKISDLETELSHAGDEIRRHTERTKILDEKNLSCTMSIENLQDEALRLKEAEEAAVLNERLLDERASKAETEVQLLKQDLARLGGENEAAILQYKQCLEKISVLETKLFHAEDETRRHLETIKILDEKILSCTMLIENFQDEVVRLKEAEETGVLNERASKAETEVQLLKQDLARLEGENEDAILQYKLCLEKISGLETELSHFEDETTRSIEKIIILEEKNLSSTVLIKSLQEEVVHLKEAEEAGVQNELVLNERASKAETEVQILKQDLARLEGENDAAILRYKQSLEKISDLETKLSHSEDETTRHIKKIMILDEKNLSCTMSIKNLQDEVLCLKEAEEAGVQNEQLLNERASKAETEVQILRQDLTRLEGESEAATLRYKQCLEKISDLETKLSHAEDEIRRQIERTKILDEKNSSCTMLNKNLQDEVLCLKETEGALRKQVELCLDERNASQQMIYSLKEEISELNVRYHSVIEHVEHVGFKADSVELSVLSLQQENSKMKELYHEEKEENASLLAKLEQMENLLQANAHLETSLLDVNVELEELRGQQMALEETSKSLHQEKSNLVAEKADLVSQVEIATENLARLAEKTIFLEKSLYDVNAELEESSMKSKILEESFHSLENQRLGLVTERDTLITKLESMRERLEGLEKCCADLGDKNAHLEKEKEALLHEVAEVQGLLDQERKMHASFAQSNEILIANLEDHIRILQEKHRLMENEFEEEQDKMMEAQLEIFIWQTCIRDAEEKSYSILIECQKQFEASKRSEKLILDLEQKNLHQQLIVESLSNQVDNLKMGIHQASKLLKTDVDYECPEKTEDERLVQHILKKIEDNDSDLLQLQDDKQELLFEKSVLVTVFQQVIWDLQNSSFTNRNENSKVLEEIKFLRKDSSILKDEKCMLEEENIYMLEETMVLSNLCLILKNFGAEKSAELKGLGEALDSLEGANGGLQQEIEMMREGMEMVEAENLNLKAAVEKLEIELNAIRNRNDSELRAVEVCNMDLKDEHTAEFVKLKANLCALIGENKEMKSEMTKYAQDMGPLVESIEHVEDLMFSHMSSSPEDNQEIKDVSKPQHDKSDLNRTMSDGIPDLHDLQRRVKAFEKALIGMKTGKAVVVEPKEVEHRDDLKRINSRESELEISSGARNVIIVKDIPLDQVASSSSQDHGHDLYATGFRRSSRIDEEQLESWGIIEKDCTDQGSSSSTTLPEEKEMVVDNLKVPKRVSWAHDEENKKKFLQKLACDNLKLSNLKGTVQGLRKKVKKIPSSRRAENSEYDKVEGKLQEIGEAVIQLLDSNKKLRKKIQETVPENRDGNVSAEAQRMCEKIECLESEAQKMQLILMKLDNEHAAERSLSAPARRKRLQLRDYLYTDKEKQ